MAAVVVARVVRAVPVAVALTLAGLGPVRQVKAATEVQAQQTVAVAVAVPEVLVLPRQATTEVTGVRVSHLLFQEVALLGRVAAEEAGTATRRLTAAAVAVAAEPGEMMEPL